MGRRNPRASDVLHRGQRAATRVTLIETGFGKAAGK
jgi:hypothetical protein